MAGTDYNHAWAQADNTLRYQVHPASQADTIAEAQAWATLALAAAVHEATSQPAPITAAAIAEALTALAH